MPVNRNEQNLYRARVSPMGTQQRRQRPRPQSASQEDFDRRNHLRDLSPFEPFEPSQTFETQATNTRKEPFPQRASSTVDLSLQNQSFGWDAESIRSDTHSQREESSQPSKLQLLHVDEWDEGKTYDERLPSCIHYSIEWKVTFNNKLISKDTEQNLVLAPIFYWPLFLQPKLEKLLCKKLPSHKRVRPDDTNVVVSVTDRSARDLTKRFDETEIDWQVIQKQLVAWGELFRAGKKLRVDLSFNYIETGQLPSSSARRGDKRSSASATQQMRMESITQIEAEEESSGQPSIWRDVYNLMRCPGPPCHLGPHCWRDPLGKKHYKLKTHQLKGLIRHVEEGGHLQTHDDVPEDIRQQLYAEEQQRLERQHRATNVSSSNMPPINITNVLPGPPSQSFMSTSPMANLPMAPSHVVAAPIEPLVVPGLRDIAMKEYTDWQQSQVGDPVWKAEFQKAYEMAMKEGLDLEQIHKDRKPGFFTDKDKGVMSGVARRFVNDIEYWVKQHKSTVVVG